MNVDWYWTKGLFDAVIQKIEIRDIPYDYTEKNPIRNCLTIYLDSQNAIYDTSIKELRFYNHKLITGDVSITGWWKNDNLKDENGRFVLTIDIGTMQHDCILQFSFDNCHVIHGTL